MTGLDIVAWAESLREAQRATERADQAEREAHAAVTRAADELGRARRAATAASERRRAVAQAFNEVVRSYEEARSAAGEPVSGGVTP